MNQKQPLEVFCKKGVLRNFAKFTGKYLCESLFFNRPATLLKKRLWNRCFLVNFAKFLRTPFLQNTSGPLLLMNDKIRFLGMNHLVLMYIDEKLYIGLTNGKNFRNSH